MIDPSIADQPDWGYRVILEQFHSGTVAALEGAGKRCKHTSVIKQRQ
jgi:hypothetical protein